MVCYRHVFSSKFRIFKKLVEVIWYAEEIAYKKMAGLDFEVLLCTDYTSEFAAILVWWTRQ